MPEDSNKKKLNGLDGISAIRRHMEDSFAARDEMLRLCREIIRFSSKSIKAMHRNDFAEAEKLLKSASVTHESISAQKKENPALYYSGYVTDAQKELAEAYSFMGIMKNAETPAIEEVNVEPAAFINGLAESIGEMRRRALDLLRADNIDDCELMLSFMEQIHEALMEFDFPDSVSGGLRRHLDLARGIIEKTRGDLTSAAVQMKLRKTIGQNE